MTRSRPAAEYQEMPGEPSHEISQKTSHDTCSGCGDGGAGVSASTYGARQGTSRMGRLRRSSRMAQLRMVARASSRMVLESSSGMGRASSRVAPFRRRLGRPSSLARPRLVVRARYEVGREASSALGAMARLTARRLSRSLRHAQEALTQGPFMQDALMQRPLMSDRGRPIARQCELLVAAHLYALARIS